MTTLTIRNLNEQVKSQLRINAAHNGWAMEEEVRRILMKAVQVNPHKRGLGTAIHQRFKETIEFEPAPRTAPRVEPQF